MEDPASKDKWKQMATSLYCFGDHMKFRSLGPGASQFEVEQGKEGFSKTDALVIKFPL